MRYLQATVSTPGTDSDEHIRELNWVHSTSVIVYTMNGVRSVEWPECIRGIEVFLVPCRRVPAGNTTVSLSIWG